MVCTACVQRFAADAARCARCGLRRGMPTPACGACLTDPPPFDACVVACDYAFPWDRLIANFKFNTHAELARPLARLLTQAVQRAALDLPEFVLPVPLAPGRLAERGYDQAWELARHVARALRLPAHARWLERPIDGARQTRLIRSERLRNLRGAFGVRPSLLPTLQGRHVALVDDVMTTGATLRSAATALRTAGVARVDGWVLARTPAASD